MLHIGAFLWTTPEQWHDLFEAGHYIVVPLVLWIGRQAAYKLDKRIETTVDARVTESRALLIKHINDKFDEHEKCDERLLARLRKIEVMLERRAQ